MDHDLACKNQLPISLLISQLKQAGKKKDLHLGKSLDFYTTQLGYDKNIYVASSLISMYSKCGDLQQADHIFITMTKRNVITWTALITGYVENGLYLESLNIFESMDCAPNSFTFASVLKACSRLATESSRMNRKTFLQKGMDVHRHAWSLGFDKDIVVASTLVDMYIKFGEMQMARGVFEEMRHRDVVTWNVLILGYMEGDDYGRTLEAFSRMDCTPNAITFSSVLNACSKLAVIASSDKEHLLRKGISIHERAKALGLDNEMVVASAVVDMYCKCGNMQLAQSVFRGMKDRNVVLWTCLINGYVKNGQSLEALALFESMECGKNHVTFVAVLKACVALALNKEVGKESCLRIGLNIHAQAMRHGLESDLVTSNILIEMYGKLGEMKRAQLVFDEMKSHDVVSWTVLVLAYVENEESTTALKAFYNMDCQPDHVTLVAALKACKQLEEEICLQIGMSIHRLARNLVLDNEVAVASTLVDLYSRCGDMHLARVVFDGMKHRETITWTVLITGYIDNGECSLALDVFRNMDCPMDRVTFMVALRACSNLSELDMGQRIHDLICKSGYEQDEKVANSLLDFYGKCGKMEFAEDVFNRMQSRDVVSWNSLIGGYSSLGWSSEVFASVKRMQDAGVEMNEVTMQLILTTCSHGGLLEEGRRYFDSMSKYGLVPTVKHYSCMVDILGRANKLEEALSVVRGMNLRHNRQARHVWMSLLGACRKWGNVRIGEAAFKELIASNEDEKTVAAAHVLLRNIYMVESK